MAATNAAQGSVKDTGKVITFTGKSREGRGGSRYQLSTPNEYFEHFNGSTTIPAGAILANEGTAVNAVTYGVGLGGTTVLTSDDVTAKSVSLTGAGLTWQANRQINGQPLVFECKWKAGTLATREFFLGVTDALSDTDPIALSLTSTFTTSVPTDGAWIGYSDTPTSGGAFLSGGNSHTAISITTNTNTVVATGTTAFVTDTYYTYRIEIDVAGNAAYFVDGKFLGFQTVALNPAVPLTWNLVGIPRATAGSSEAVLTVDYVYLGGV